MSEDRDRRETEAGVDEPKPVDEPRTEEFYIALIITVRDTKEQVTIPDAPELPNVTVQASDGLGNPSAVDISAQGIMDVNDNVVATADAELQISGTITWLNGNHPPVRVPPTNTQGNPATLALDFPAVLLANSAPTVDWQFDGIITSKSQHVHDKQGFSAQWSQPVIFLDIIVNS